MKSALALIAALALTASALSAEAAAPCRDGKGKFIKCPPVAAKTTLASTASGKMAVRCRTAAGAFAKCGSPGAKPVAALASAAH